MYKEYHPSPLLSPYIDKYWEFKGQPGYGMHINILPDGCTDFIFTLGEAPKAVHDSLVMQPYHAYFIGAMTKYSELVTHTVTIHMLGIRFLPCGILRFMDLPLQELTNLRLNADELTSLFTHSLQRDWANWEPFKSTWSLLKTSCFKPYADTVQKQNGACCSPYSKSIDARVTCHSSG